MKIAVASEDGVRISGHFGRSRSFIVFEVEDQQIKSREVRENRFTAHALGQCHGEQGRHGNGHEHAHGHSAIVEALSGCQAVLCYGMGWRAAEALQAGGIQPLILEKECTPEEAVLYFLRGELKTTEQNFCRCHEH
jgi:predicted Fe-Mo cluster-binding NifX family protein